MNYDDSFNPCFNGSMYKNTVFDVIVRDYYEFQSLF